MLRYPACFPIRRVIFLLLEITVLLYEINFVNGMLIAKSGLTLCDSVGKNPHNVVDNRSCQKKLIIAQAVRSGQVSKQVK